MIKKMMCFFVLGYSAIAISAEEPTARVIDIGKMGISCIPGYKSLDLDELAKECNPFNGAVELCAYFSYLEDAFQIDTVIETGTCEGKTTAFFGFLFNKVHTMEIDVTSFQNALSNLRSYPNIEVHYGNSPDILKQVVPSKKNNRVLFYLDAHSPNSWPILQELDLISKTHRDNCIIVINEIKVPNRNDIPYGIFAGKECSYEYVKNHLSKVFSNYYYYYVIPKSSNASAIFVAIPRKKDFSSGWSQ